MTAPAGSAAGSVVSRTEPQGSDQRPPGFEGEGAVVVVDARGLLNSGIGRYLREVLAYLFRDSRFAEVRLLGHREALREFCERTEGGAKAGIIDYPYGFYSPRAQLAWLRIHRRALDGADVVFFPHYDAPFLHLPSSSVVAVHDLTHFRVPEHFPLWRRTIAGALLRRSVAAAGSVAVLSDSTARDLVDSIAGAEGKIRIIPPGVSEFFQPPRESPRGLTDAQGAPFLLCVGNRKPHKNLTAAVEVLAHARREVPTLRLVFAGPVYAGWEEVLARAAELGVRGAIDDLTEVSDEALRSLYQRCSAFLFLSRYEGFGLPVLEAMACGAPVIASNRASIPEVVGDAGILVSPDDHEGAASAILRLLGDPRLSSELARRGAERARRFSWDDTGRRVADLLLGTAIPSLRTSRGGE